MAEKKIKNYRSSPVDSVLLMFNCCDTNVIAIIEIHISKTKNTIKVRNKKPVVVPKDN